jgi:hypothetical protein
MSDQKRQIFLSLYKCSYAPIQNMHKTKISIWNFSPYIPGIRKYQYPICSNKTLRIFYTKTIDGCLSKINIFFSRSRRIRPQKMATLDKRKAKSDKLI